jgi:cation diffusion facilitator family transporter
MQTERYLQSRKVTLVAAVINLLLAVLKIVFGLIGRSHALLADGVHSLSDLLTDAMVIVAAKAASGAPDQDHPYGHGRIETAVTVLLAAFLIAIGAGIIWDAILHLISGKFQAPSGVLIIGVAVFSIVCKEALYHYTMRAAKRVNSSLLKANAWHHRSDALSTLIVIIGVIGTLLGLHYCDAIAAIIVALLIIKMAISMAWVAARELVDTGIDAKLEASLLDLIVKTPGVKAVHQFRSRLIAGDIFLDVHVQVNAKITVSEGHFIAEQVEKRLHSAHADLRDITIHIDPENDEMEKPSADLPPRQEIEQTLKTRCADLPGFSGRARLRLHYLNGKVDIEIGLPVTVLDQAPAATLLKQYQDAITPLDVVRHVSVIFMSL